MTLQELIDSRDRMMNVALFWDHLALITAGDPHMGHAQGVAESFADVTNRIQERINHEYAESLGAPLPTTAATLAPPVVQRST